MGNNNPGRYRREGRNAFCPDFNPEKECPYANTTWSHRNDWMEGWKEEEIIYQAVQKEQAKYEAENWEYNSIREDISKLAADPALINILENMIDMLEKIKEKGD